MNTLTNAQISQAIDRLPIEFPRGLSQVARYIVYSHSDAHTSEADKRREAYRVQGVLRQLLDAANAQGWMLVSYADVAGLARSFADDEITAEAATYGAKVMWHRPSRRPVIVRHLLNGIGREMLIEPETTKQRRSVVMATLNSLGEYGLTDGDRLEILLAYHNTSEESARAAYMVVARVVSALRMVDHDALVELSRLIGRGTCAGCLEVVDSGWIREVTRELAEIILSGK